MDIDKVKKIVGSTGMALVALSAWMTTHAAELATLFPKYASDITAATAIVGGLASLWGTHPLADPSTPDNLTPAVSLESRGSSDVEGEDHA